MDDSAGTQPENFPEFQRNHGEPPREQNEEEEERQPAVSSVFVDINRHKRKARELEMSQQSSVELEKSSVTVLTSVETKERESNAKEPDVENGTQRAKNDEDEWPFLLRFPMTVFGITMGLGSHAIMWKNIAHLKSMRTFHVPRLIGAIFWFLCLLHLLVITTTYCAKLSRWPKAVHLEFLHPVRSNYFAAPFICCLFLVIGAPSFATGDGSGSAITPFLVVHVWEAFFFTAPLILYEVHLYGRWLMSSVGRLSEIGNPTTQIAVVGNFVSATTFALAGYREMAIFPFTVGIMHQMVVFAVIFSGIPPKKVIGVQLRPSYFLFVAPPSVAAVSWSHIQGRVDDFATILTFMGVFFLIIMVSRASFFFTGVRFSLAWWAFTFPSAAISIAVMNYASSRSIDPPHMNVPKIFSFVLVLSASLMLIAIYVCTFRQALSGELFGKDEVVKSVVHVSEEGGLETQTLA
ncbi:protein MpSLAC2 [Marchantia polymorpha subsp. ruderalis]|uniref:Uncharacterized protein n=2 Tax=Marchantia polymorpha TaxID=3197 RepID=A0AAF6BJQ7_MARPO|nr:hypothetical protein MARPO_0073s0098 [Marchantia polymorpha]BBN12241.1 hypothetical protein Mp_5g18420 [Marchantia polymorpha subsp. ruderalis]|eukprot:PTQ35234.1 hypothetical protein MARPO_0073s0098 [Marchantia polymorpha]